MSVADSNVPARTRTVAGPVAPTPAARLAVTPLPVGAVALDGGFWGARQERNREVSIPIGARRLHEAGNLEDLTLARAPGDRRAEYRGPVFMDSDVHKWLEAVAWELGRRPDPELRAELTRWTAELAETQEPDGYLNSWVQAGGDPSRRYRDLAMNHELYCLGHLIQAAVAARRAAGFPDLLDIARRAADHLVAVFMPADNPGLEGHPVIEMALVELYRETGERSYLTLAEAFVRRRGQGTVHGHGREPIYFSDRVPVAEADHLEGHAVRALYLASGVADVASELAAEAAADLDAAQRRQWEDLRDARTYLTGGMGSRWDGEAFGDAHELPVDRAYCETCAAIAAVQWSWRRLLATGESRHADLIERILFNGFASGTSLAGDAFFYVNALRVRDGAIPDDHRNPAAGRHGWYEVACCPPNVMRTVAQLGGYLATTDGDTLHLQQYAAADVRASLPAGELRLSVRTDYPWDGRVEVEVRVAPEAEIAIALRIPEWGTGASATVDGGEATAGAPGDYLTLRRRFAPGERIVLELPVQPRITPADPRVDAIRGCVAVEAGPLVYCLEDHDQPAGITADEAIVTGRDARLHRRDDLLGGVTVVQLEGGRLGSSERATLTAIPYHAWANRGVRGMRVWIPLTSDGVS